MNIAKILGIAGLLIFAYVFAIVIAKDKTTIEQTAILLLPLMGLIAGFMLDDEIRNKKEK